MLPWAYDPPEVCGSTWCVIAAAAAALSRSHAQQADFWAERPDSRMISISMG